jgi:hypothetical protein
LAPSERFEGLRINHCDLIDGWMSIGVSPLPKVARAE